MWITISMGRAFEDGACQRWGGRAVCREGDTEPDCVMINSVSNQPMVSDMLNGYGHVYCFLDNGDVGRKTMEEIRRQCEGLTNKAAHYLPHKDLDKFLQHRMKKAVETCTELK